VNDWKRTAAVYLHLFLTGMPDEIRRESVNVLDWQRKGEEWQVTRHGGMRGASSDGRVFTGFWLEMLACCICSLSCRSDLASVVRLSGRRWHLRRHLTSIKCSMSQNVYSPGELSAGISRIRSAVRPNLECASERKFATVRWAGFETSNRVSATIYRPSSISPRIQSESQLSVSLCPLGLDAGLDAIW
jgi:hypothetical protein